MYILNNFTVTCRNGSIHIKIIAYCLISRPVNCINCHNYLYDFKVNLLSNSTSDYDSKSIELLLENAITVIIFI